MNAEDTRNLDERKAAIIARLSPENQPEGARPVVAGAPTRFTVSGRMQAVLAGGLAAIHALVERVGLAASINAKVVVLHMGDVRYVDQSGVYALGDLAEDGLPGCRGGR